MNTSEIAKAAKALEGFDPEAIACGQAVSVCSLLVEMGLLRATLEDVVDGLYARFEGMIPKSHLEVKVGEAIETGLKFGMFERLDEETVSLSDEGKLIGEEWLARLESEKN